MDDDKVERVMKEFKEGELHSGSKEGPKVEDKKQAIAIALSEADKANKKSMEGDDQSYVPGPMPGVPDMQQKGMMFGQLFSQRLNSGGKFGGRMG